MRSLWLATILIANAALANAATSSLVQKQTGARATTRITLNSGIAFSIPAKWKTLDSATSARVQSITDSGMAKMQNKALRDALRAGRPQSLFAAHHPTDLSESVNLNAAPSPGTTAGVFAAMDEPQIAKALEQLCPVLGEMSQRMNQRMISCNSARPLKVNKRTAAVTEFVRTGQTGFVHVWLVQFPDNNVVFTLTLSCLESARDKEEPVLRRIWESIDIPVMD